MAGVPTRVWQRERCYQCMMLWGSLLLFFNTVALASTNPAKRQKSMVTIVYHAGFTGRAEAAMLLCEDTGIEYNMHRSAKDYCCSRGGGGENKGFPAFACPALVDGDFTLAQTVAMVEYLGQKAGRIPKDPKQAANHLQLNCDAADLWAEGYKARRDNEDKGAGWIQPEGRCVAWLRKFEASLDHYPGEYAFSAEPSAAEYAWLNALRTMEFCYGESFTALLTPAVKGFMDKMCARPKLATFLATAEPVLYDKVKAGN